MAHTLEAMLQRLIDVGAFVNEFGCDCEYGETLCEACCAKESLSIVEGGVRSAYARIESLEAERDGLRRMLDSVLDTNPSGDCWCDSGHEHAGTVCMGCWARGRRPKQSPLARMAKSILTAGYPRSQCDPRNDPSSEIQ